MGKDGKQQMGSPSPFYPKLKSGKGPMLRRNIENHWGLAIVNFHFPEDGKVFISECFLDYQSSGGVQKLSIIFYTAQHA